LLSVYLSRFQLHLTFVFAATMIMVNKGYHYGTTPYARVVIARTRCSAIAERPRCRVRYSFRQR